MAEVVGGVALEDQATRAKLLERARDLLLGAAAREPQRVGVEGAPDQRGGAEHLRGGLADGVESRLERRAHAAGAARALAGGEQLGDEQRQPLALAEDAVGRRLVEPGLERQADHVGPAKAPERDPLAELGEARIDPLGVGLVGAPRAQQQQRAALEAAGEVAERLQRRRVAPLQIVDPDHPRVGREGAEEQPADRLEEAQARARLIEAPGRRRAELGQQASGVGAQGLIDRPRSRAERRTQQRCDHAVGEPLLAGVGVGGERAAAAGGDLGERLLGQPRLADPGLALDHDERPLPAGGGGEGGQHARELAAAADQGELAHRDRGGLALVHRRRRGAAVDRVVELGGLPQRRHSQLAVELAHALAVLHERVAAASGARVEVDQPPVRRLVQRVQHEPLAGGGDRLLEAALLRERVREAVERARALATQRLRHAALPVVELEAVAQREAREQTRRGEAPAPPTARRCRPRGRRRRRRNSTRSKKQSSSASETVTRSLRSRSSPSARRSVESVRRSAERERSASARGHSSSASSARAHACPLTARNASAAVALRVSTASGLPSTSMRGAPSSAMLRDLTGGSMA